MPKDRLEEDARWFYTYDDEGRLATRESRSTGGLTTYTWNTFDQLVASRAPMETPTSPTTVSHPFWVVGEDAFVDIVDIPVGAALLGSDGGAVTLVEKAWQYADVPAYNFEVENQHNYFAAGGLDHDRSNHGAWRSPWGNGPPVRGRNLRTLVSNLQQKTRRLAEEWVT